MKRAFLLLPLLALSGCAMLPALMGGLGGAGPSPASVANKTTLDEKGAIGIETAYTAAAMGAKLAFKSGLVKPSADPDAHRANFCKLVLSGLAEVTDTGGKILAADCKAKAAVDAMRAAYDAGNSKDYLSAYGKAKEAIDGITTIIATGGLF